MYSPVTTWLFELTVLSTLVLISVLERSAIEKLSLSAADCCDSASGSNTSAPSVGSDASRELQTIVAVFTTVSPASTALLTMPLTVNVTDSPCSRSKLACSRLLPFNTNPLTGLPVPSTADSITSDDRPAGKGSVKATS